MPPYDSDSSDEGEDYTETNVLLGYASKGPTGDSISHIGAEPSWIDNKTSPSGALAKCKVCNDYLSLLLELNGDLPDHFPGHERRLYIWSCRRKTCRRKEGSVRGIRGVRVARGASGKTAVKRAEKPKVEEEKKEEKPQANLGGSLFGVKDSGSSTGANPFSNPFSSNTKPTGVANPFASAPNGKGTANPFAPAAPASAAPTPTPTVEVTPSNDTSEDTTATLPQSFADKVRISSPPPTSTQSQSQPPLPHEPWPSPTSFPPPYPHYHLDAEYETLDTPSPSSSQIPSNARMDIDPTSSSGGGGGGSSKEDKDIFESSMDRTFQRFADRVGQNPEQVLRYEFSGKPLLYSDGDAVGKALAPHSESGGSSKIQVASRGGSGMPRCANCGAERVFEVQLTPHAITELEADEIGMEGMEWGTIVLGVCERDCKPSDVSEGEVGYVEEWVGVQWEEVASKR